jgi:hypothetical protein
MSEQKKILVTTEHKGVFAGKGDPDEIDWDSRHPTITLDDCRNCVKWSTDMHGFMGLAAKGPSSSCRIGPAVDGVSLADVTGVYEIEDDAYEKWEEEGCNF